MSIRDRGLEPYQGTRTAAAARWLVIARRSFSSLWRRRGVWVLLVGSAIALGWPTLKLVGGGTIHMESNGAASPVALDAPSVIFADITSVLGLLLAFGMAQLTAASSICDDARAFPFYFARPVTRDMYLAGKLVGAIAGVAVAALAPELVLWGVNTAVQGMGPPALILLGRVLAIGAIETLVFAVPLVALSASLPKRTTVQATAAALFFLPWIIGAIFSGIVRTPWPKLLSIPAMIESIGARIFGIDLPADQRLLPPLVAAVALTTIVGGSLLWTRHRLADIARGAA